MHWIFLLVVGLVAAAMVMKVKEARESQKRCNEIKKMINEVRANGLNINSSSSGIGSSVMAGAIGGAATLFLLDQIMDKHDFDQETLASFQDMDFDQLQDFALQNNLMEMDDINTMMNDFDPYLNPGQDIVIDEYYHGIDHDLGYVNPDYHDDSDFGFDNDNGMSDFGMDNGFNSMNNF